MVCLWVFGNEAFARIQRSFHTFFLEGSKEGRAQFLLAEPAPPSPPREGSPPLRHMSNAAIDEWLATEPPEEVIEPELPIIDVRPSPLPSPV